MLCTRRLLLKALTILFFTPGCLSQNQDPTRIASIEDEKRAILGAINAETRAAFGRDYEGWKAMWVQEAFVTKTYMTFSDSSFSETLGFQEIDQFIRNYFADHPEPDPYPAPLTDIEVRLYGTGAWVTYEQEDPSRGRKRETRLMEKVDGQWKIAGMHTTIYGLAKPDNR